MAKYQRQPLTMGVSSLNTDQAYLNRANMSRNSPVQQFQVQYKTTTTSQSSSKRQLADEKPKLCVSNLGEIQNKTE